MSLLCSELWLPRPPAEVFPFFSDARNLEVITPPWLRFSILTPMPIEMRVGARIEYRLSLRGLPLRWESEITDWVPGVRFRDEQRRGPYRRWVHTHTFHPAPGGTRCVDTVDFAVWGGRWVERWFVHRDLRTIFEFRQSELWRRFGDGSAGHLRPWRVTFPEDAHPDVDALRSGPKPHPVG